MTQVENLRLQKDEEVMTKAYGSCCLVRRAERKSCLVREERKPMATRRMNRNEEDDARAKLVYSLKVRKKGIYSEYP